MVVLMLVLRSKPASESMPGVAVSNTVARIGCDGRPDCTAERTVASAALRSAWLAVSFMDDIDGNGGGLFGVKAGDHTT